MMLTVGQQKRVEENIGLVHKVIKDKVHGAGQWGIHTYDDLFQIGCIGLCKAAATDKGGTFSTYAYRLIWNEICSALIQSARRQAEEVVADVMPYMAEEITSEEEHVESRMELNRIFALVQAEGSPSVVKGVHALVLMSQGYTSREIGAQMGAAANLVCAWASKARKFLQNHQELKTGADC